MSKEGSLLNKRFRFLVIALLCLLCGCSIKGDNLGAKAYKNGKCVAFYPPQSEKAKAYAMKLCEREDEMIFDYVLEKAGDYEKLTQSINNSTGAAEKMANVRMDNLRGQMTLLQEAAGIPQT